MNEWLEMIKNRKFISLFYGGIDGCREDTSARLTVTVVESGELYVKKLLLETPRSGKDDVIFRFVLGGTMNNKEAI